MLLYLLRRLVVSFLLLVTVLTVLFFGVRALPGDPVGQALTEDSDPTTAAAQRRALGLDRPLAVQYVQWLAAVAQGDFGTSFASRRSVRSLVAEALPNTVLLAAAALLLRFLLGVGAGAAAAMHHGRRTDRALVVGAVVLTSIPAFWLGLLLQLAFAYRLGWLPAESMVSLDHATLGTWGRAGDRLQHLVLPVLVLALGGVAATARHTRASLVDTLAQEHVRAARARGIPERALLLHHALRPALVPVATLAGLSLPALVGGALVVETLFAWPGMGRLAMHAVATRDYPVLLASTGLSAVLVIAGSVLADVACWWLDPRVRGR